MKSPITAVTVVVTALSWPGALSMRSQETTATQPVAGLQQIETDEERSAIFLAEVRHQTLAAAAADAGAQVEASQREVEQQLAKAQRTVQLAQAPVTAAPRAAAGAATAPPPVFQPRLQAIVNKGRGASGRAVVIRTSDGDAKSQAHLEEDLAVMSRILDKTVAKQLDYDHRNRFMGINVLFAPGSGSIRNLYLEGYGALFLLNVNFPLLPPPEKVEPTKEKSETDSTWEETKQELYGQSDAWAQAGKTFKFSTSPGPQQEYDKDKVDELKEGLLEALKNATNIRTLKADESITVCVFGGVSAVSGKTRAVAKRTSASHDANWDEWDEVLVAEDGPPARGTIMTIRVKKSDVDAFAKGKLNLDDFSKKASITTYAGDTGGWSGGAVFGTP